MNIYLSRNLPGRELLFQRWLGARAFLVEKNEPYGADVAREVQLLVYNGRLAYSSEYPYALNDPFFIVLLYTPLAVLREGVRLVLPSAASFFGFPFVRAFWMFLSEVALIGIVLHSVRLSEWAPPRWLYAGFFLFGLFGYFSLNALAVGTPTIILLFLYLSILLAIRSDYEELAGGLLSLVVYQWEVGGLFFLFIMVLVISNRQWKVLITFGMAMFIFLAASFLIKPDWGMPYIRAVLSDWYRTPFLNLASIVSVWFPQISFNLGRIVSLLFGVIVFIEWIGAVHSNFLRIFWTACLSLAATPLVGFAIFPSNHVVLIPSVILILSLVWERWTRRQTLMTFFVFSLMVLIPFGLYYQTSVVYDRLYTDLLSLLPPLVTILGLYWMRWWVLRPPRTWADQLGNRK
ncbi:MAG: hypothetical protein QM730_20840 [Anaerolineales bacterium]